MSDPARNRTPVLPPRTEEDDRRMKERTMWGMVALRRAGLYALEKELIRTAERVANLRENTDWTKEDTDAEWRLIRAWLVDLYDSTLCVQDRELLKKAPITGVNQ